jgi:hypothetical protein
MLDIESITTGKATNVNFYPNVQIVKKSSPVFGVDTISPLSVTPECPIDCCELINKSLRSFYSCFPSDSVIAGLGYKLGLAPPVTGTSLVSSIVFNSTINGLSNSGNFNVFMQVNTEHSRNLNNMDVAMNENYNMSNETTGQVKHVAAKILLNGLTAGPNVTAQTVIQNPVTFNPPLGKLDKLSIRLLFDDAALTPVEYFFPFLGSSLFEWDATYQIDEEVCDITTNSNMNSIPTVKIDPSKTPF